MHFLKPALKLDLVNYSALARVIKPLVEEKMGERVELETIIMAIRRNAHVLAREAGASALEVIKDMKVELKTGIAFVTIKRKPSVYEELMDLVKSVNKEQMENIYVTQRFDEISILTPEELLPKIQRLPAVKRHPDIFLEKRGELALINIKVPSSHLEVPGIYALLTTQLAEMGISLMSIMASFTRLSIVCREVDAPLAYDKINKLIRESKETLEKQKLAR
jgi:aspartokinase